MRKFILLSLLVLSSVFHVQAAQVTANFKVDVVQSEMYVTVQNQSSKDAISYKISFGDNTAPSITNSYLDYSHQYASAGTYSICMVVTDSVKGVMVSDSICEMVTILDNSCKALFEYSIKNLTVQVKNTSIGDFKKVYWDFGDGSKSNKTDSLSHTYEKPGVYNVALSIVNSKIYCASDTVMKLIVAAPNQSIADFTYTIADYMVSFKNNSIGEGLKYQWNFGDGSESSDANPIHVYAYSGEYQVVLLIKDKLNQHCIYKYKLLIKPNADVDLPRFDYLTTIGSDSIFFLNKSIGNSDTKYLWSFGDSQTSLEKEPSHKYAKKGNYNVCLTSTNSFGNHSTNCQRIIVGIEKPITPLISQFKAGVRSIDFMQENTAIADSFRWYFGDGEETGGVNPNHTFSGDSVYLVKLISYVSGTKEFAYQIVNLTDNPNKLICRFEPEVYKESARKATGKRVKFRGTLSGDASKVRFSWDFGDGSADSLNLETEHIYYTDSVYQVCFNVVNTNTGETETFCEALNLATSTVIDKIELNRISVQAFPNPVTQTFKLQVQLSDNQSVTISVYEISGRKVYTPYKGYLKRGKSEIPIENRLSRGIYIIDFRTQTQNQTIKLVVN